MDYTALKNNNGLYSLKPSALTIVKLQNSLDCFIIQLV